MFVFHIFSQAASTSVAMPGLGARAHSTDVAFLAVEYALFNPFFIIETACLAVVLCEIYFACDARFSFWLLLPTKKALNLGDLLSLELMT